MKLIDLSDDIARREQRDLVKSVVNAQIDDFFEGMWFCEMTTVVGLLVGVDWRFIF